MARLIALAALLVLLLRSAVTADTPQGFIARWSSTAVRVNREYGIPASVVLAQAALESGWGSSDAARNADNYFGLEAYGATEPFWSGAAFGAYRSYSTPLDSWLDYGRNYHTDLAYRSALLAVLQTGDPVAFITAVAPTYSPSDASYARSVIEIINQWNLTRFDLPVGQLALVAITG